MLLLVSVVHSPVPPAIPPLIEGICDHLHLVDEYIKIRFTACFTLKVWLWKVGFENSFRQLLGFSLSLLYCYQLAINPCPPSGTWVTPLCHEWRKHWKAIQLAWSVLCGKQYLQVLNCCGYADTFFLGGCVLPTSQQYKSILSINCLKTWQLENPTDVAEEIHKVAVLIKKQILLCQNDRATVVIETCPCSKLGDRISWCPCPWFFIGSSTALLVGMV